MIRLYGYSVPADPLEDFTRTCCAWCTGTGAAGGGQAKHYADVDKAAQLTWPRRLSIACSITSALSFFHNSSATTGGTVFHRDVRAPSWCWRPTSRPSSHQLRPGQVHPADPAGAETRHSVFTRTGMRFGTPGYRCPPYCESGEYDATSEIYSLGVVLSELLTGQDGKFYDRDTVEDERLAADERAGQWPAELVLLVWSGPGWWLAV